MMLSKNIKMTDKIVVLISHLLVERPFLKENLTLITNGRSTWLETGYILNK